MNTEDNEILIYQSRSGEIKFHGDLEEKTVWANLNQIASLSGVKKEAISQHLTNIFESDELS
jgi:hypothetical protein